MELLFLLAHASTDGGDALVLLLFGTPVALFWGYIIWTATSRPYEPGPAPGDWHAVDEEDEE